MEIMERPDAMETISPAREPYRAGMAFLVENPEAFGMIPDACPVSTGDILVAANGHAAASGSASPILEAEGGEIEEVLQTLYRDLLPHDVDTLTLLRAAFGSGTVSEHLLSRYSAVLAEMTVLHTLRRAPEDASLEDTCALVGSRVRQALRELRENATAMSGEEPDGAFFTVSTAACRIRDLGSGDYGIQIFSSGDFRLFLLDQHGMAPLWTTDTPALSPDGWDDPVGRTLRITHPEPFAILLLSGSLCALNAAEHRGLREAPGMIWRYRMRLEEYVLRLITSCVREKEFAERATRHFTGRAVGRDSGSGVMSILRGDASYEVFRSMCQERLVVLERMIATLPEGYDPDRVIPVPTRPQAEHAYAQRLLARDAALSDRVGHALRRLALQKLAAGKDAPAPLPPADVPAYRRLSWEEVWSAYRVYDAENDADRALLTENHRALREGLSDHWVTLRPCFLSVTASDDTPETALYLAESDTRFIRARELAAELGARLRERSERVAEVEDRLQAALNALQANKHNWIYDRTDVADTDLFATSWTAEMPKTLAALREGWQENTEAYRACREAYLTEREALFALDVLSDQGFFAADLQSLLDGSMSENRFRILRESLTPAPESARYVRLWDSLRRISLGTAALNRRIRERAAESRMARDLSDSPELRVACLRAAAYEDSDWGEDTLRVMDAAMKRDYREMLRRWQEDTELASRRADTYREYSTAYTAYIGGSV